MHILKATITAFALGSTMASASSHGNKFVMSGPLNGEVYIMAQSHMALYTYDGDALGVSNCYGGCAASWPPAILDADTDMPESYSLIQRKDGTWQVAYKDQPLYLWVGDRKIGDYGGDGIGGVWHLARP